MHANIELEVHFHDTDRASVYFENAAPEEDRQATEVILFCFFALRQLSNISGSSAAHALAHRLSLIRATIECSPASARSCSPDLVDYQGTPGRKRFRASLRYSDDSLRFILKARGFGLFARGMGFYAPHSVLLLFRFLTNKHVADAAYIQSLCRAAEKCGDAYLSGKLSITNQYRLAQFCAIASLATEDDDDDENGSLPHDVVDFESLGRKRAQELVVEYDSGFERTAFVWNKASLTPVQYQKWFAFLAWWDLTTAQLLDGIGLSRQQCESFETSFLAAICFRLGRDQPNVDVGCNSADKELAPEDVKENEDDSLKSITQWGLLLFGVMNRALISAWNAGIERETGHGRALLVGLKALQIGIADTPEFSLMVKTVLVLLRQRALDLASLLLPGNPEVHIRLGIGREPVFDQSLALAFALQVDPCSLAASLNARGVSLYEHGKLDDAITDLDKAIEILKGLLGKSGHRAIEIDLASGLTNRGLVRTKQGKYCEAVKDHDSSVEILRKLVQCDGRVDLEDDLAGSFVNRGISHSLWGKFDQALSDYEGAIRIRTRLMQHGRTDLAQRLASAVEGRDLVLEMKQKKTHD